MSPGAVDGGRGWRWRTDADGNWWVTPALRDLFDYYLSAVGEAPVDELVRHIRASLVKLPEPARRRAEAVLREEP